jgi:hypothetical protein
VQIEGTVLHLWVDLRLLALHETVIAMRPGVISVNVTAKKSVKMVWVCEWWEPGNNETHMTMRLL